MCEASSIAPLDAPTRRRQCVGYREASLYLDGAIDLEEAVRRHKTVRKVVYASSSSVYGEAHELPLANPAAANPIMLAFLRQKPL